MYMDSAIHNSTGNGRRRVYYEDIRDGRDTRDVKAGLQGASWKMARVND